MKILLLMLTLFSLSYAEGLDALLNDYEKESELSNKTKDESAGNLIIYTRDDLERMQAESLQDILKSLRLFGYAENRLGQPDILNQDPLPYYSSSVRVYLNETELLTSMTGSGLVLFGNMELDFIDHIEIYQGFPSFDFGVEAATIVIRLYTKSAKHDEGGRVKANFSTNGANKENVYYTNIEDDISYFIYANHTDDKKETYNHNNETLKRDSHINRFYGSVGIQNHTFDFHVMHTKGDAFMGLLVGNIPQETSKENLFVNLSTNSKFMNDTLTLNLSYIKTTSEVSFEYSPSAPIIRPTETGFIAITSYKQALDEDSFTASLKKEWDIEAHTLSIGAQYRYKKFDVSDYRLNGIPNPKAQVYDKEDIYSLYIQDLISINDNNLVSLSIMDQEYVRNEDMDNQNTLQLRLGYIYTNKEWIAKTFVSSQEFATEPYMGIINQELEKVTYKSIIQEVSYQTPQTLSKVILGYGINENMIIPTMSGVGNSNIDPALYSAIVEFTLYFSQKDKLELQANYWRIESPMDESFDDTEHISYVIRMLNTVSSFDVFNELVIHNGFSDVGTGYDFSTGVKYQVNKDFHINVKGVNIFDTGRDRDYINQMAPTGVVIDSVVVPVVERRFTLGMEYLF